MAKLRPRARIVRTIGDQLISGPEAALIELVKNAYDADSPSVGIKISSPGSLQEGRMPGEIVVADTGHGMSATDIITKWFEPATTDKVERGTSPTGRPLLGAKGVGRFATARLGSVLQLSLRLRGISSRAAANAYAPRFVADFNKRFAKPPKSQFDAHRAVRDDEDLDLIFTWRVLRKVSSSLTLQHDRVRYLLPDTPDTRKLIHRYIEVFEYPDRRIELRADGSSLDHVRFDELPFIDAGAIVENKRLGHALRVAQVIQSQRDDRRSQSMPSRTNSGAKPRPTRAEIGKKRISTFTLDDMNAAVQRRAA